MIPYGRQDINQQDIDAVVEVLQSDFLTQGPMVPAFEKSIMHACNAKYAIAVNSATSALHIACLALGLGKGDWLWTTPNTFVASANCGLYCGAQVDFVDIDPSTYNLSVKALEEKLIIAEKEDKLPKVVIPVHFSGQPCDMAAINTLSQKYGFKIIEDASHAIGGKYKGEPIGNCRYSDITVFSFHPVKIVTTAEGGMAVTNDPKLAEQLNLLRSHGITRDESLMTKPADGPWYYQQIELGYNYRMTDMQAALGVSQMQRLNEYVTKRHELAERYNEMLKDLPITLPWQSEDSYSGLHLYVIRLQLDKISKTHLEVFNGMREAGILVNLHYIPVHLQPYYQEMGFREGDFLEAEQYYKEAISLPMFPTMTEEQQNQVVSTLKELLA
ncbi:UDP-4-amino-4,6-dideoxy-N-acetyl-beta-L-altrosamine transaminase [Psychrobacter phenylpyruvicus]|uniref:UDP-4-amino-4-deoxy-L-arabinose--oxoglutarate aminotransferase n=2 Tax=Psychrobacter phenylpyruvicus TaxID=29432 RepID=A0A379LPU5_9GAMM|nr:UDP-4-amino-4,6-dideoxy-N-acetyl-beta-L-altrosamine transaminase [Psychrobacter phenylpyruvicus]SUD91794.1 UDP-4-amino-4-deoxy-L-arabinose--oxoglutarate aminotransferase [Psychrobacter phenylpyruvicus]